MSEWHGAKSSWAPALAVALYAVAGTLIVAQHAGHSGVLCAARTLQ